MGSEANTRLADLFGLTGWSKGELARLVNRHAAAMGHPQLATDTSRVRRWIETGESPREPVPRVLAALFTERLGRVVTIEDLGFDRRRQGGKKKTGDGLPWPPERTAAVLTEFTGMDLMLNRRGLVGASAALTAGTVLSAAMYDWLHTDPALAADAPVLDDPLSADPAAQDLYEAVPVGAQEIESLEHSVEVFRAWDASRGGGLQRKAVVGQLNEVGGMLSYRHPAHLQRRLWGVAANLAVLAGWMSHDVGLEPTAQKYFVIAAHAAREGGDRPRAGEALSRAARQMVHLDRPADALDLMRLAASGSGEQALPRTQSMLRTIEAWAQAAMGRDQEMRRTLGEAEELFAADHGDLPTPSWMQNFDEADLHGMQALAYRTLAEHDPSAAVHAQAHARRALELRGGGHERSVIFDHLSLASACFIADDPEQADSHARKALTTIGQTSSHRTWDRLRQMHKLTDRYAALADIQELRREIEAVLPKQKPAKGEVKSAPATTAPQDIAVPKSRSARTRSV
ncbi:DNA-binding protein NsdB [Actinacidiphila sp. bgisy144]|uniref:DNA-binding protein NsdB n=1 Tax=unclassified Actinacidiphila TaxID=2995708 RepID=UPI003EBF28E9